ncbi:MAG: hypothetical protein IJY08_02470 [Clostridia bacterium]|nr:hypothetical protein [Clostridia bacterium]
MKKLIAVLMCLLMLTVCFVACGGNDDTVNTGPVDSDPAGTEGDDVTQAPGPDDTGSGQPDDTDGDTTDTSVIVDDGGIGNAGGSNAGDDWTNNY